MWLQAKISGIMTVQFHRLTIAIRLLHLFYRRFGEWVRLFGIHIIGLRSGPGGF